MMEHKIFFSELLCLTTLSSSKVPIQFKGLTIQFKGHIIQFKGHTIK